MLLGKERIDLLDLWYILTDSKWSIHEATKLLNTKCPSQKTCFSPSPKVLQSPKVRPQNAPASTRNGPNRCSAPNISACLESVWNRRVVEEWKQEGTWGRVAALNSVAQPQKIFQKKVDRFLIPQVYPCFINDSKTMLLIFSYNNSLLGSISSTTLFLSSLLHMPLAWNLPRKLMKMIWWCRMSKKRGHSTIQQWVILENKGPAMSPSQSVMFGLSITHPAATRYAFKATASDVELKISGSPESPRLRRSSSLRLTRQKNGLPTWGETNTSGMNLWRCFFHKNWRVVGSWQSSQHKMRNPLRPKGQPKAVQL